MVTPQDQTYCYHYNSLGSTIGMTNQNQVVVNQYAYDPFGNITNQQEGVTQPFKFVGQFGVLTEPNGFYYMRARYYDPKVGRFVSEDPLGFGGGHENLSVYVADNPVMRIDPNGTAAAWWHYIDGFRVGYSMGNGFWGGIAMGHQLGKAAMAADFNEHQHDPTFHATTNDHAVSSTEAINASLKVASQQWATGTIEGMGNAIHILRDLASHEGSYFPDPNASALDYAKHIIQRDLLPGGSFDSVILKRINNSGCSK